jgi:hypothetical protein
MRSVNNLGAEFVVWRQEKLVSVVNAASYFFAIHHGDT